MRLIAILLVESLLILANPLNKKQSEEWMDSNKIRLNPVEQLTGDVHGNEVHFKRPQEEIISDQITVLALAVGQGDSTFIKCPNNELVIIDMGSSNGDSVDILNEKDVNKILIFYLQSYPSSKFRIIITHPDEKHYNYLIGALYGLESSVEYFILAGDLNQYSSIEAKWFSTVFANRTFSINGGSTCYGNEDCKIVPFGKSSQVMTPNFCNNNLVKFTILAANLGNTKNSKSAVIKMEYGNISMLFPGDFTSNAVQNLIIDHYNNTEKLSATIYKMAHHGSATQADNLDFLNEIKPKAAFASQAYPTSTNDAFPSCTVVDDLIKLGIRRNSRIHPFVCGNSGQQPSVHTQWDYEIYETCRQQPYNMCYNIRMELTQTDYVIGYLPIHLLSIKPVVKSSGEEMEV